MRDYLLFYVNGRRFQVRGETAFASLSDFLRYELQLTGTKVVCAEGDCGACTVLVGRPDDQGLRYETVDACIQFLYQLDCKHIVTVEGLRTGKQLHPVQQAMVEHHGSQCGYCTPGFVMALAGWFEQRRAGSGGPRPACGGAESGDPPPTWQNGVDRDALRIGLTGNLCRCTGYLPILEAGLSVDAASLIALGEICPSASLAKDLREHGRIPVLIQWPDGGSARRTFFAPRRLEEAITFKAHNPEAVIVSGGTELGVLRNKKGYDPPTLLTLAHVPGMARITCDDHTVAIGANVTWTQVEAFTKDLLPELYRTILRFGSPQIRNVATLVANVAHGSPIADALPFLFIMDAELELVGRGGSRRAKVNGLYKGYKVKDLAPDEIITRVLIPLPAADELLKLYKVSRRTDLDIATFGAGIRVRQAGDVITRAYLAYSGVGPTVVRLPATEAFLQGKLFSESTFREAGHLARTEIQPISDVRGSRDFRLLLAENILLKFYFDCVEPEPGEVSHVPRRNALGA
jgi:xanthine dehydrogenase small subunit